MKTYLAVMLTLIAAAYTGDWIDHTLPCYATTGANCKYNSSLATYAQRWNAEPTCWRDLRKAIPRVC